jgi:hypothetical protein
MPLPRVVCVDVFVTGHESGEMVIWHDVKRWLDTSIRQKLASKAADKPVPPPAFTTMHWHAHAGTFHVPLSLSSPFFSLSVFLS